MRTFKVSAVLVALAITIGLATTAFAAPKAGQACCTSIKHCCVIKNACCK